MLFPLLIIKKLLSKLKKFYMRLIFYIFLISQLLNFIGVFAEKVKEDSSRLNSVNWKKVNKNE